MLARLGFLCVHCPASSAFALACLSVQQQQTDACIVVYYDASETSSWHSFLPVAKGLPPECGAVVEVSRLETVKTLHARRKETA